MTAKKRPSVKSKYGHFQRGALTEEIVHTIKHRLWYGESTVAIARELKCPANTIVNIYIGHRWAGVPWPNKATGAMPKERRDLIEQVRKLVHEKEVPGIVTRFLKIREKAH